jgi:hypothetical protein
MEALSLGLIDCQDCAGRTSGERASCELPMFRRIMKLLSLQFSSGYPQGAKSFFRDTTHYIVETELHIRRSSQNTTEAHNGRHGG